jgi:acyl-CoA reductase-like NAD-dependent aldehyde dehydrogenase
VQTQTENTTSKSFVPNFEQSSLTALIERQREFFASGKTRDVGFRMDALKKLQHILLNYEKEIGDALKADLGKPFLEAYSSEIAYVKEDLHYVMKRLKKWARPQKVSSPMVSWPARSMILPEPYGNTLIIAPWNYPFQLTVSPLIGAIAAGNTAILKPSEVTPRTQELICRLINQAFPAEYIYCVGGGVKESQSLLEERFDFIFFTGSTKVGKIVAEKAAKYLTPTCLELGGKSPCIVDKNIDMKTSARRIVWGKFLNAGQSCVAPDYVLIHKDIYEAFTKEVTNTITEFFGKDPHTSDSLGRVVNTAHFDRLQKLVEPSKVIMSTPSVREENFMAPTVMKDVAWNDRVMDDEIFGPVLPLMPYSNLEEAMAKIQSRPKPLALYLFSTDSSVQEKVLSNLSYGGACVNDTMVHLTNPLLPFGGVGESGVGSYHGRQSFDLFSHKKSVMKKPFWGDATMRYAPYTSWKLKLLRFFLG